MAYQATLINKCSQFGAVTYDLTVVDDAAILPPYRHSISLPVASDTAAIRNAIRTAAAARATAAETFAARRQRVVDLRDDIISLRLMLLDRIAQLQALIDANVF